MAAGQASMMRAGASETGAGCGVGWGGIRCDILREEGGRKEGTLDVVVN